MEETVTDPKHPHAPSGTETDAFRLSRGTLLRGAAGAMVGMSPLLAAACGDSGGSGSTGGSTGGAGKPVRGGMLTAGLRRRRHGRDAEPVCGRDSILDESRVQNLYDPLFVQNPDLSTAAPASRSR